MESYWSALQIVRAKEKKPRGLPSASLGIMETHEYKYCAVKPFETTYTASTSLSRW